MKRVLLTASTLALLSAPAFAQDLPGAWDCDKPEADLYKSDECVVLRSSVYTEGSSMLSAEGYTVTRVTKSMDGSLTFDATNGDDYRKLTLDAEGNVMSDQMASASTTDEDADAMASTSTSTEMNSGASVDGGDTDATASASTSASGGAMTDSGDTTTTASGGASVNADATASGDDGDMTASADTDSMASADATSDGGSLVIDMSGSSNGTLSATN